MVKGEVLPKASIQAQRVQLETAFNRAQMRGHSLSQALEPSMRHGDRGYYDGRRGLHQGTYRWGAKPSPTELAAFKRDVWDPVVGGSNYSDVGWGPMTGNASAGQAALQYGKGTPGYRIKQGGDTYFREGPFRQLPAMNTTVAQQQSPIAAVAPQRANLENLNQVMGLTRQLAPGGIAPETMRQSGNFEDDRLRSAMHPAPRQATPINWQRVGAQQSGFPNVSPVSTQLGQQLGLNDIDPMLDQIVQQWVAQTIGVGSVPMPRPRPR
jgi:hypothetical protein